MIILIIVIIIIFVTSSVLCRISIGFVAYLCACLFPSFCEKNHKFEMFELLQSDAHSCARKGLLHTKKGSIQTPEFMPVGTRASVKSLDNRELLECGTQIILANAYHLALRPGMEIIQKAGGLHRFMNWDLPILSDSGGFQVFSLARIRKVQSDGVAFRSHLDGSAFFLGPKESMSIQRKIASDIAMTFDECPPHDESFEAIQSAVLRTIDWAAICKDICRAPAKDKSLYKPHKMLQDPPHNSYRILRLR